MPDQSQKTPLARSLNQFAERKIRGAMTLVGQSLPASVVAVVSSGIVTVKFELTNIPYTLPSVTVPLFGPEYIRYPIQPGCKGFVVAADAYIGGMSGLGGGVADLTQMANLSTLVFFPIGNRTWTPSDDPNSTLIYGPDGTIIRNIAKTATLKVTTLENSWTPPEGQPVIINGNVIINGGLALSGPITNVAGGTYAENIQTSGNVIAGVGTGDQVGLSSHTHPYINESSEENTSPPNPGT